eukprot:TRINITY_DN90676_c0_g1_i1.p1 TRINITY_DN90676_c0_g1~~TRINITY_DN90676_c0_g1_i1.p1  ORF type:complete len:223 (+),score=41.86 TRINITY_DN90676_c0_g1_i1:124-792(+)
MMHKALGHQADLLGLQDKDVQPAWAWQHDSQDSGVLSSSPSGRAQQTRGMPTAFSPFSMKCPDASSTQYGAIMQAKDKMKRAMPLAKHAGVGQAFKLASRASESLKPIGGWFTYYINYMYTDLPSLIHDARMDVELASQSCANNAPGSDCGRLFACAADDLSPYDPMPNLHPMESRLSAMPAPALLTALVAPGLPGLATADRRTGRRRKRFGQTAGSCIDFL